MIELRNLTVDTEPPLPDGTAVVHPFYKTSFLRLSGLPEEAVSFLEEPRANGDFLAPLLRSAAAGCEKEITRFYDVRTTEEYGQAAPEYALLARAGLRRASPLSVKGKGALPFALELAEEQLERGEAVLFCCAELYTPLDGRGDRRACAFVLRRGEGPLAGGMLLAEHRFNMDKEEALAALERPGAVLRFLDGEAAALAAGGGEAPGLVGPFVELLRAPEGTEMLMAACDGARYGYLLVRKGGTGP